MKKKDMVVAVVLLVIFSFFGQETLAKETTTKATDKQYDVVFKAEGGSFTNNNQKEVKTELIQQTTDKQLILKPIPPVRENFKFVDWYIDKKTSKAWDFNTKVSEKTTLFAKWEAGKTVKISFKLNGDSQLDTQVVEENNPITLPKEPTKTGYKFGGWYSDEQLSKTWSFKTKVKEDLTLYAKWDELPVARAEPVVSNYQITFSSNGGSEVALQEIESGGLIDFPSTPTKEGFVFDGWYSDEKLTKAWDFKTPVTNDRILYAKWLVKTPPPVKDFNVKFESNGGSKVEEKLIKDGAAIDEPTGPAKKGFVFKGWYSDRELTKSWNFKKPVTEALTLYAKWLADTPPVVKEYKVIFKTNGGSEVTPQQVKEGATVKLPSEPKKKGFTFKGWYSDEKLTKVWDFKTVVTKELTLYGKWTEVTPPPAVTEYQVIFKTNGDSQIAVQQVKEGETIKAPSVPYKKGATFVGWYSDEKLTMPWDFKAGVTSNLTLYGKWTTNTPPVVTEYQVAFKTNGGSNISSKGVKEGELLAQPTSPTKQGFTFAGWYRDEKLTKTWDFKTEVWNDLTLYAKWNKVPTTKKPTPNNRKTTSPTERRNLPQTGEVKGSQLNLVVGGLLLLLTLIIVLNKSTDKADEI